jgi:hypothetical protein
LFWAKLRTSAWTGISNGPPHVCHVPRLLLQPEPPNVIGASEEVSVNVDLERTQDRKRPS